MRAFWGAAVALLASSCLDYEGAIAECLDAGYCQEESFRPGDASVSPAAVDAGAALLDAGADSGVEDAGVPFLELRTCTSSAECAPTETCHPRARVCVRLCGRSEDCPASSPVCDWLTTRGGEPSAPAVRVCQCLGSSCGLAKEGGVEPLCAVLDRACVRPCDAQSCGPARRCELPAGQCQPTCATECGAGKVCDESQLACVPRCRVGGCAAELTCSLSSGWCESAASCPAGAEGRSVCGYGQYCSAARCRDVPLPTCPNFQPPHFTTQFDPPISTGPILYAAERYDFQDNASSFCPETSTGTRVRIRIRAYRTSGLFPSTAAGLTELFYVSSTGARRAAAVTGYATDGGEMTGFLNLCVSPSASQVSAGLYFVDGNELCATITR